jgi:hypothetical protein
MAGELGAQPRTGGQLTTAVTTTRTTLWHQQHSAESGRGSPVHIRGSPVHIEGWRGVLRAPEDQGLAVIIITEPSAKACDESARDDQHRHAASAQRHTVTLPCTRTNGQSVFTPSDLTSAMPPAGPCSGMPRGWVREWWVTRVARVSRPAGAKGVVGQARGSRHPTRLIVKRLSPRGWLSLSGRRRFRCRSGGCRGSGAGSRAGG